MKAEFALALLPTLLILGVFAGVELFTRQRLLFASLASSAFLIYLDPHHRVNSIRTLLLSQTLAALVGYGALSIFGEGYLAAASAMVVTIALMILLDAMHPPAVSTALGFAFKSGPVTNLTLFVFALGLIVALIVLQRASVWLMKRVAVAQNAQEREAT